MTGSTPQVKTAYLLRIALTRVLPVILIVIFVLVISGYSYLASPLGAARISSILATSLQLPVRISRISLNGDTLVLKGVELGNPQGFPEKHLLFVESLSLAPGWKGLLSGRATLRFLSVDGPRLHIQKGSNGDWNIAALRKRFSGGKGGAELFIAELRISKGEFLVNGKGINGLSLAVRDLASKGSVASGMNLDFCDEWGNRYRIDGSFRGGAAPEGDLSLEAPTIALGDLAGVAAQGMVGLSGGKGSLRLKAGVHDGVARANLKASVNRIALKLREADKVLLSGKVNGSVTYDLKRDRMELEELSLAVDDMLDVRASGRIDDLKRSGRYGLVLEDAGLDLGKVAPLVPGLVKTGTSVEGRVGTTGLKLSGVLKSGLSMVDGTVFLRDLALYRRGKLLAKGIATDMRLETLAGRISARGELKQSGSNGAGFLERLEAPYQLTMSGRMKAESMEMPRFSASLMGVPLTGSARYVPKSRAPLALSLQVPENRMNPVTYGDFRLDSGVAGVALDLKGSATSDFGGSLALGLKELTGSVKGERFAIKAFSLNTLLKKLPGQYSASGEARIDNASFKGVDAGGGFGFRVADGMLQIENSRFKVADTSIALARLAFPIPMKGAPGSQNGYPIVITVSGGAVVHREIDLSGIDGALHGTYGGPDGVRRFEGGGAVAAKRLLWRGMEVGAPKADVVFSRTAGDARLGGTVFGGLLNAAITFDPYADEKSAEFDLSLKGVELKQLSQTVKGKGGTVLSGGELTLSSKGNYSRKDGVNCRIRGEGKGIAVSDAKGKGLLSDAGLTFDSSLTGEKFLLPDSQVMIGEGAVVRMKGEVAKPFTQKRYGEIVANLPRTPLVRIVDPLANSLPRVLQEATISGDVAAEALLTFRDGRTMVDGFVQLDSAGIDAESQKLKVEGVGGRVPFSTGFPAARHAPPEHAEWTREGYGLVLNELRKGAVDGSLLKIAKIGFGPLEIVDTAIRLKSGDGTVEAVSFSSSLTTGSILGRGRLSVPGGGYGGDIIVNNLSLHQLCALFPKIKGYVSGRVDGLARVAGRSGGGGPDGSLYLWTREGDGEKMLVSREFLQKLAGKNLQGFFFRDDRPFDTGEVRASLESGYLTFDILDISHTNIFGVRDLKVSVTEAQNRIALEHLMDSIKQAAGRAKKAPAEGGPVETAPAPEFKWDD